MSKTQETTQARPTRGSLWRNRNYLLLWSGQTISSIGGGISLIAFPWLVLSFTGSPLAAGLAGLLRTLPNILYLFAGALVDRWNRKLVMIICDSGRALSLFSIPLALWLGHLTLGQLYLNASLEGILQVFFSLAYVSSLPQVVRKEHLMLATAQEEVTESITGLLGPALAGPLFAVARLLPFLFDACSYVISVVSLLFIGIPFQAVREPAQARHLWQEVGEGLRWMWRQPVIRAMNLLNIAAALVVPGETLIALVLLRAAHTPDIWIGLIFASGGVGALVSATLAPAAQRFLSVGQSIILVRWLFALLWPCYLFGQPLALGLLNTSLGFVDPFEDVPYFSYRLAVIPEALRGRVIGACRLFTSLSNPLGQLCTGAVLQYWGVQPTIILGTIILVLVALGFTLNPHIRAARFPQQTPDPAK
ncbi:MFS transporter [Ktedonosporobacter rubrisoli]|uniref:MFS transporter n=1 Tax=Ktedonosporobacter rubrisoli TaxID=2509675 RepID=A0A4P6JLC4_KTERU|nr:MFS transporter [Ktedonosporobacter rubrisoli]QBD75456.1 MFS transporter [Ktedonosporobacter rubrisoli]